LSCALDISVKNALTDPATLNFDLWTQGHSLYLVWTLWDHSFLIILLTNRQTDRQTNKQTAPNAIPTPTDIVGVG